MTDLHQRCKGSLCKIFKDHVDWSGIPGCNEVKLRTTKIPAAYQDTFCNGNILEVMENISAKWREVPFFERTRITCFVAKYGVRLSYLSLAYLIKHCHFEGRLIELPLCNCWSLIFQHVGDLPRREQGSSRHHLCIWNWKASHSCVSSQLLQQ